MENHSKKEALNKRNSLLWENCI